MLEKYIQFFIHHNERILWISAGFICCLVGYVVYREIFVNKGGADASGFDMSEVEATLKRILEQTNNAIGRTDAAAAGGAAVPGVASGPELEKLKKELEERAKLVEELKKQVVAAKSSDQSSELLAKIKNLEGRLAEYEIIEDDIADLSHYKEENARLKKELESLKTGGAALVDEFAAAVAQGGATTANSAPTPATPKPAEPAIDENIGIASSAPSTTGVVSKATNLDDIVASAQSAAGLDMAKPDEETPMADLSQQVVPAKPSQAAVAPAAPVAPATAAQAVTPAAAPTPAPASAPTPAPTPAPEEKKEKSDIFAEFSEGGTPDPMAELGDIDTNRMLAELEGLNSEMDASALDEVSDLDKMADEAAKLGGKS